MDTLFLLIQKPVRERVFIEALHHTKEVPSYFYFAERVFLLKGGMRVD